METRTPSWLEALLQPAFYDHPAAAVELVETHASWVFLAGDFAYKVKKPVDFGFLDFSSREKRRHFCHEELRLNRRTAPDLYLAVVTIGGDPRRPALGGMPALDYAVKMRRFPRDCQLDRMLAAGRLEPRHLERFGERLADIHRSLPVAPAGSPWGTPDAILAPVEQNFRQLAPLVPEGPARQTLSALEAWSRARFEALTELLRRRRAEGFVRECHGDVHLANIAWLEGEPVLFDCIEFNANFRWIDLVNDAAFLVMDLDDRGCRGLGWSFLNRYLRAGGDYRGLALLRYYQVYRALVRAKVTFLRLAQEQDPAARQRDRELAESYLALAAGYTAPPAPQLLITHGLSGSGKSTFVAQLAPLLGAITLHSDAERKRLHGLAAREASDSPVGGGIYRPADHQATYARLRALAGEVLADGFAAIVDATCLSRERRGELRQLAGERRVPFTILDFQVAEAELRRRVGQRAERPGGLSEATPAVLEKQLASAEPLSDAERRLSLAVRPGTGAGEVAERLLRRAGVATGERG